MAVKAGTAYVAVEPDLTGFNKGIDKAVTGTKGKFAGLGKKLAVGLGAVAGFDVLRRGVGAAVDEYEEARKVGAQTNAVLKSTGGAAKVTARDVGNLATALSKKTGIDDEAIQSGENLLLTFKNIRNETGRGNDVFNQATTAAVDMSAALGQDMKSSAIQLGKALNDPIKGVTALQRVGVSFTESQKAKIKSLVEEGDTLKAQKLILRELNSQFGGAAAAKATSLDKLKVSVGNLAEAAGAVLVPMLDKAARFLSGLFNQMVEGKATGGAIISVFKNIGFSVGGLVAGISALVGWFRQHETVSLALGAALGVVAAGFLAVKVQAAIAGLIAAVTGAVTALNVALAANPIILVVGALALLAAGLVVAYRNSETFRDIVNAAWGAVKAAAGVLWNAAKVVFPGIVTVVKTAWGAIRTVTTTVWNGLKAFFGPLLSAIATVVRTYFGIYRTVVTSVWGALRTATSTAWNFIKGAIINPIREAAGAIRNALGGDGLLGWLRERFDDFKGAASRLTRPFVSAFGDIRDAVKTVLDHLGKVVGAVKEVISFLGKIKVPKINLPDLNPIGGFGTQPGVGPGSMPSAVDGFNATAARFGLGITSGYRAGDDGYHGLNRARDYSNSTAPTPQMMAFAKHMIARFGSRLKELFYSPLGGSIKDGRWVPGMIVGGPLGTPGNHYNHVHVAMHDGGWVKPPGGAREMNATLLRGEYVLNPADAAVALRGGGTPAVVINVAPGMEWLRQFITVTYQQESRRDARTGGRILPGRAGALA